MACLLPRLGSEWPAFATMRYCLSRIGIAMSVRIGRGPRSSVTDGDCVLCLGA